MRIDCKYTNDQKHALEICAEALGQNTDEGLDEDAFHILDKCDGCIPEDCIGDDVLADIRKKFHCVFWAACCVARDNVPRAEFDLLIDPSYDDNTRLVVLDLKSPYVCLRHEAKAWNFNFAATDELANFILRTARDIARNYAGDSIA